MTRSWVKENRGVMPLADAMPGIFTWMVFFVTVVALVAFPRQWLTVCAFFMLYFIGRMVWTLAFYLVGEFHVRSWTRKDWRIADEVEGPAGFSPADVWHVVVIPNYKEPIEILERTLDGLARQHRAAERVVPVLGMEEREKGSEGKGRALAEKYADKFARVIVTVHPGNIPDELPGKSSNESWAAAEAYEVLTGEMGVDIDRITVTSCDADSVLHEEYLAAVAKLFSEDERRYARFWQAPLLYINNLWQVPAPTRFTMWIGHAVQMADLAMPFYEPLPVSTYTLSLRTAVEAGLWDPMVIAEDWHSYLNVMFERQGDVCLTPVFLPACGDATDGDDFFSGLKNRHEQVMRHAWGAEDSAFVLRRMVKERQFYPAAIFRFFQVFHDHVMRTAAWFLVMSTYLLVPLAKPVYAYSMTRVVVLDEGVPFLPYLLATGAVTLATTILLQLLRYPPPGGWSLKVVLELAFNWLTMPVFGFYLGALPAIRAQTRLMLGIPLAYKVTPKRAVSQTA